MELKVHLGLVADWGHTAMIYEGEHALAVVAGDELYRNADAVQVCVTRATGDLQKTESGDEKQDIATQDNKAGISWSISVSKPNFLYLP